MTSTWAALDPNDGSVIERFVDEGDMLDAQQDPAYEGCEFAYIADPNPEGDL